MKFKALILAFVFLFGGSGLSIDIAKCCDSISGLSISLKSKSEASQDGCCSKIKPSSKKSCCSETSIQTVINSVVANQKTSVYQFKKLNAAPQQVFSNVTFKAVAALRDVSVFEDFDHCYPVPVLLRKRVLQI